MVTALQRIARPGKSIVPEPYLVLTIHGESDGVVYARRRDPLVLLGHQNAAHRIVSVHFYTFPYWRNCSLLVHV